MAMEGIRAIKQDNMVLYVKSSGEKTFFNQIHTTMTEASEERKKAKKEEKEAVDAQAAAEEAATLAEGE